MQLSLLDKFKERTYLQTIIQSSFDLISIPKIQVQKVATNNINFIILDNYGKVYSIGTSNQFGILGRGYEDYKHGEPSLDQLVQLKSLWNEFIVDVAISSNHCLALSKEGQVFSWGFGLDGCLGFELLNLEACVFSPTRIEFPVAFTKIFTGPSNSGFVTEHGQLFICGQNQFQCCNPNGNIKTVFQLQHVQQLAQFYETCQEISFSNLSYSLIVTQNGKLLEMGFSASHDCAFKDLSV